MTQESQSASRRRYRWSFWGLAAGSAVAFALLATLGMVTVSSQPPFCGSCHVMAPYYESWKGSSHQEVACVECHIPPGLYSEIEKKTEAMSMVVSYFTGTYGTNPWAEVDDIACLECHKRRLLSGREVFGDILFDHGPHLTEMRRGKQLRCTSCHSQIVQGSHISVTTSTCILCHFKDQEVGAGFSDCETCHEVPNHVVEKGTLTFDHGDVERFDMDCAWCHAQVVKGDGSAPRERCFVCHNDQSRIEAYDDHERLHEIHVTEHKVECLHCHTEIQHGTFGERHKVVETDCQTCHEGGHSPQRDLLVGIGGKGAEPRPSAMHLAGIQCAGCHFMPKEKAHSAGSVKAAGDVSCMACHGPEYGAVYQNWQQLIELRVDQSRQQLSRARRHLPAGTQALADAQTNLALVEMGRGVHNIDYAIDMLWANHTMLNEAASASGVAALEAPWRRIPYESDCLRCHQGIELQAGPWNGRSFDHSGHVTGQGLDCLTCHLPHDERAKDEAKAKVVRLSPEDCQSCHHSADTSFESRCAECHTDVQEEILAVEFDWGEEFDHALHIEDEGFECVDCHAAEVLPVIDTEMCLDCHE
jgi:hypothetical protein